MCVCLTSFYRYLLIYVWVWVKSGCSNTRWFISCHRNMGAKLLFSRSLIDLLGKLPIWLCRKFIDAQISATPKNSALVSNHFAHKNYSMCVLNFLLDVPPQWGQRCRTTHLEPGRKVSTSTWRSVEIGFLDRGMLGQLSNFVWLVSPRFVELSHINKWLYNYRPHLLISDY